MKIKELLCKMWLLNGSMKSVKIYRCKSEIAVLDFCDVFLEEYKGTDDFEIERIEFQGDTVQIHTM